MMDIEMGGKPFMSGYFSKSNKILNGCILEQQDF